MKLKTKLRQKARQTPSHQRQCKQGRPRARLTTFSQNMLRCPHLEYMGWPAIQGRNKAGFYWIGFVLKPSYWVYTHDFQGRIRFRLKHQPDALRYHLHRSLTAPWSHHWHASRKQGNKTSGRWYVHRIHRWMGRIDPNDSDIQPCMRPKYFDSVR